MIKKIIIFILVIILATGSIYVHANINRGSISYYQNVDDSIVVSGNAGGNVRLRKVTAIITYVGKHISDVVDNKWPANQTIEYLYTTMTQPNGDWEFEWLPTQNGEYNVAIIIDGKTAEDVYFYSSMKIKEQLKLDILNGDEAKLVQVFSSESNLKSLEIDLSAINDIANKGEIGRHLFYIRSYTDEKEAPLKYLDIAVDIVRFINTPNDLTFKNMINKLGEIGLTLTVLPAYENTENEVIQAKTLSNFAEKFAGDLNNLNDKFLESIVLSAIRNVFTWTVLDYYLELLNYDVYNKSKHKEYIALQLAGNTYSSISELKTEIEIIIAEKKKQEEKNNIGDYTGGGNGGSKITVPLIPETSSYEEMQQEKIVFDDVKQSHWAFEAINYLRWMGYIVGSDANLFYPDENIKRSEIVKMLVNAFNVTGNGKHPFVDVYPTDWFNEYVSIAYANGLVNGDGERFKPSDMVTREDMAVMIYRFSKFTGKEFQNSAMVFDDRDSISSYAKEAVGYLYGEGIIQGVDKQHFEPLENATRAQAVKLIYEIVK